MSLDIEDANETQQLMQNEGEEEEQKVPPAPSPVASTKLSSGAASFTSKTASNLPSGTASSNVNDSSKISYVNEKRSHRDQTRSNSKPKHIPKDAPDVKHMEKALLELLDDFHTGKLSAFSAGCSMEQMINIRDQQEHLARLHFKLCADVEMPPEDDSTASQDKMAQLVHSLEQLSTSIENLHSTADKTSDKNNAPEK